MLLPLAAASGCITRPVLYPWPCLRVSESPKVDAELREMKATGEYRATRLWVIDADAKCAADRVLAGKVAMKEAQISWYERGWLGGFLRWLRVLPKGGHS